MKTENEVRPKTKAVNFSDASPSDSSKNFFEINKIYCADAIETMSQWPDGVFDACITDPPYNIAKNSKGLKWAFSSHETMHSSWDQFTPSKYEEFTFEWFNQVCRLTKKNGNIFIFGSFHNIFFLGYLVKKLNLKLINNIIWAKPNSQPNITCRMFTHSTEQILWICNNVDKKATKWTFNYQETKKLNNGKQMKNFWVIPTTPKKEKLHGKHPSQKPMAVMERIVQAATNEGDLVLDCFSGSGSTLLACKKHQRNFIGIEKSSEYVNISTKRLENISTYSE